MLTLDRAARLRDDSGTRLPKVWDSFESLKIVRRRGQLYLTAAAPGGFKSVLALNEAIKQQSPCLYLSMDTDPHTMAVRVVQMWTHTLQDAAEEAVSEQYDYAMRALSSIPWVKFSFPSSPDVEEIVHRVFAYAETEGDFPHWIVVDNLMDVAFEGDEHAGLKYVMEQMAKLARQSKAGVHVLHHLTGEYENGDSSPGLKGIMNKVSKKPSMVLTMHRDGTDKIVVSVPKNRYGPCDPAGLSVQTRLLVAPELMSVWDVR